MILIFSSNFSDVALKLQKLSDYEFEAVVITLIWIKRLKESYNQQKQPTDVFCKKGVFKIFAKLTGKHLCQVSFLILSHRCFPVNFVKFLRTPFLEKTSGSWFCCSAFIQPDNPD